jgi:hypothetical protein
MGRIHPDAEAAYFNRRPQMRALVAPFLCCFEVTRAFSRSTGPDQVECFYLRGEQHISELIGLEREFLVVYAPYPEFQARTIKLHDQVVSEDKLRLDPVGTMIISDDPRTSDAVHDYIVADPERPPIVAVSRQELEATKDVPAIRALLTSHLFRRDLYGLESPLRTDTTFFGRSEIVSELLDRFRGGQNSGLFGLRRIGKTSVLYALGRRAEAGGVGKYLYLDVSSPGTYQLRWWELLQLFIRQLAQPLNLQRADRSKIRGITIDYDERSGATHFKSDIVSLATKFPGKRILLLLDEIEHITFDIGPDDHWKRDFLPLWQTLRSVHQDTGGQLGFVVAGVNPHILEADRVGSFDNPLFSTTKAYFLAPFDLTSTREMVRRIGKFMGLHVEESLFHHVFCEYGGHPFLVRQACSLLSKKVTVRPGELSTALFESEKPGIALALEKNVKQILNVLGIWYPDEYEMIRMLAQGDRSSFVEFAQSSAEFTQHVEGYGLVAEARSNARMTIGIVERYLARQPKKIAESASDDNEAVLTEISRRRNRIEVALRQYLREGLLFAEGKKAMEAALASLPSERRSVLNQHSYKEVWPELYFDELGKILAKNFSGFQRRIGSKEEEVLAWIAQVNRCRADAHAKRLSVDDLAYLRVCLRRLEEMLGLTD